MGAALTQGFRQCESGTIHHKAIWFFMPVSALAFTVSESVHKDCCRPEAVVRQRQLSSFAAILISANEGDFQQRCIDFDTGSLENLSSRRLGSRKNQIHKSKFRMIPMTATVPKLNDPHLQNFIDVIANDPEIRMTGNRRGTVRQDDLKAALVPCIPDASSKIDHCWFNCLRVVKSDPNATIVFGWHIFKMQWSDGGFSFAAGHHAVIEKSGVLTDVTPQENSDRQLISKPTLFVPDSRVPFDFEELRTVPALHWSPNTNQKFWSLEIMDPAAGRLPGFGVLRLQP